MKRRRIITTVILLTVLTSANAQNPDINLAKGINPRYPTSGYFKFMSASTYFISAAVPVGVLAAGFIENNAELKRTSYTILGSIAIEVLISETMKRVINRKRPGEDYPLEIFPYKTLHGKSFPSGHTSMAFATAASLGMYFKKWYVVVPAYLWAGSVAYSRVYLGVHYPTDVLAGAVVGIGSAYLAGWVERKIFGRKKSVRN